MFSRIGATATIAACALLSGSGVAAAAPVSGPDAAPAAVAFTFPHLVQDDSGRPVIGQVAHRGASGYAPENTLAAIDEAKARGAATVEVDVQRTKDGRLVLIHDTTLNRTTDAEKVFPGRKSYAVADFTYAQIRKLDAGGWFGKEFRDERVPTLEEGLDRLRSDELTLLLELKSPERYPGIVDDVAAVFEERPWWIWPELPGSTAHRLVIQSFDHDVVRESHERLPRVLHALLGRVPEKDLGKYAEWADQINPKHTDVDAAYVKAVHRSDMEVYVYTVDEPADMRRALENGVDGMISNRPDTLRAGLAELLAESVKDSRLAMKAPGGPPERGPAALRP